MSEITIRPLNKDQIQRANSNSMTGKRGDISAHDYEVYCNKVLSWPISDEKKESILAKIYEKWSVMLKHEAQHVSVMVAGPSGYNAKRLDHGDKILSLASDFCNWFEGLERQIEESSREFSKRDHHLDMAKWCAEQGYDPREHLAQLAPLDPEEFIRLYEEYQPKYKWRKNTTVAKLYEAARAGTLKKITREVIFESADYKAYTEGDRVFIKFTMRPKRQLHVALKSRGYWWNNQVDAYSTYLKKLDREWIESIGERYKAYL